MENCEEMLLTKSDTKENEHTHTQSLAHSQIHEKSKYYIKTSSFFSKMEIEAQKMESTLSDLLRVVKIATVFLVFIKRATFHLFLTFLNVISFPPTF